MLRLSLRPVGKGRRTRRGSKGQRGGSLAEVAVILPFILVVALASVDLGRAFFAYISVTNAARNGAQYASTDPTAADDLDGIREAVLADTNQLLNTSGTNPDVSISTGTDGVGQDYAEVTVTYSFESLFAWPGLPRSVDIERAVRMMVGE